MKTVGIIFALFVAALTFSDVLSAQSTPDIRQKTFEKVWHTVNDKYWDPSFGGINWNAVHDRYSPQVANTRTDKEFYDLMAKMLGELKTSHLEILAPDFLAKVKKPAVIIGLGVREFDNEVVITKVIDNTSAAEAGLKLGYVISKIDGVEIKTFADSQAKLPGDPNTKLTLTYLDENRNSHDVVLERRPLGDDNKSKIAGVNFYGVFEQKRLSGNIGFIRFSNFLAFLSPQIKSAVESMHDAPGIIIDLRGNSGGDDSVGVKMASLFFQKETLLMISKTRKGEALDFRAKPPKNPYLGKVVILLDENSRSASEEFSAGMQESGRAVVIGKTSAGGDMDGELEGLPDGSLLLYAVAQPRTPKGYIVEGHGVKPDVEVSLSRQDLRAGRDDQLEAAIEYIKTHKQ